MTSQNHSLFYVLFCKPKSFIVHESQFFLGELRHR